LTKSKFFRLLATVYAAFSPQKPVVSVGFEPRRSRHLDYSQIRHFRWKFRLSLENHFWQKDTAILSKQSAKTVKA
jgi:hypothetical protein